MNNQAGKVKRLIRLNQFHEDRASGRLQTAAGEERAALAKHDEARIHVEQLGSQKVRESGDDRLDLGWYGAALELESAAMERSSALEEVLAGTKASTEVARKALGEAARAVRVSESRGRRVQATEASEREKKESDRSNESWLSAREFRND